MKLGVYVGSFNPIHKGHEHVVEFLLDKKYVDKMIVVPTIEYWDKQNLASLENRKEMVNIAFHSKVFVKCFPNLQYTYQILEKLQNEFLNDDLYLIIGADNLKSFDKWKNVDKILKHYVIVINRGDAHISLDKFDFKEGFIVLENFPYLDISSTQVRELIRCKIYDELVSIMNEEVIEYIRVNNLYLEE